MNTNRKARRCVGRCALPLAVYLNRFLELYTPEFGIDHRAVDVFLSYPSTGELYNVIIANKPVRLNLFSVDNTCTVYNQKRRGVLPALPCCSGMLKPASSVSSLVPTLLIFLRVASPT